MTIFVSICPAICQSLDTGQDIVRGQHSGDTMANQAYNVVVRRLSSGCDFRIRLFAKDAETACNRAQDRARFAFGIRLEKLRELHAKGIAVFRVVHVELSDDQSRPLSF